jgi:hypothetical protein
MDTDTKGWRLARSLALRVGHRGRRGGTTPVPYSLGEHIVILPGTVARRNVHCDEMLALMIEVKLEKVA